MRYWPAIPWYGSILGDWNNYSFFPSGWQCALFKDPIEWGPTGTFASSMKSEISFGMEYHHPLGKAYSRAAKECPSCTKMEICMEVLLQSHRRTSDFVPV